MLIKTSCISGVSGGTRKLRTPGSLLLCGSGVRGQNIRGKGSKGAGSKGPGSKGQGLGVKVKVKIIVSAHMKILVHVQVSGKGQSGVKVIIRVKVTGQSNRALSVADPESSILVLGTLTFLLFEFIPPSSHPSIHPSLLRHPSITLNRTSIGFHIPYRRQTWS